MWVLLLFSIFFLRFSLLKISMSLSLSTSVIWFGCDVIYVISPCNVWLMVIRRYFEMFADVTSILYSIYFLKPRFFFWVEFHLAPLCSWNVYSRISASRIRISEISAKFEASIFKGNIYCAYTKLVWQSLSEGVN